MKDAPKRFTKHQEIKPLSELPKERKRRKMTWLFFKISLIFLLISCSAYGIFSFYNTHDFRTPIVIKIQNPVPLKDDKMISPVGSKSAGLIHQVEAAEIENPFDEKSPKGIAWEVNKVRFGVQHWGALEELIMHESGWNPYSVNSSSGACGIGQALPCSKMDCEKWDYECQINWVADYIENRYETPTAAWAFWNEQSPHWY